MEIDKNKDIKVPIRISENIAKNYALFCVECDRKGLPLLELEDYINQYCKQDGKA